MFSPIKFKFEEYKQDSVRANSASEKFFGEIDEIPALIRELTQNSVDAKVDQADQPIKIKIHWQTIKLNSGVLNFLKINDIKPHLKSCKIDTSKLALGQKIGVLMLEDFQTTGLDTKLKQNGLFKRDNITGKKSGGGSHGIGKITYVINSSIRAFYGWSIYQDTETNNLRSIFGGFSVLESHKIADRQFRPHGSFVDNNVEVLPDIPFKRRFDEIGLSILILKNKLSKDLLSKIKKAVLAECYWPILSGKLEVEIQDQVINKDSLSLETNLDPHIKLATKFVNREITQKSDLTINSSHKSDFSRKLSNLDPEKPFYCQIDWPIPVKKNNNYPSTYGRGYLVAEKTSSPEQIKAHFWRDELLIKKANFGSLPVGWVCIFITGSSKLSELLRLLEDAGHSKWETGQKTKKLVASYGYKSKKQIKDLVDSVRKIPNRIIGWVKPVDDSLDENVLATYFPVLKLSSSLGASTTIQSNVTPPIFDFYKLPAGFSLKLKHQTSTPKNLIIEVAYKTTSSDSFKAYETTDFDLSKMAIKGQGYLDSKIENNRLSYFDLTKHFSLEVVGFDPDLELVVRAQKDG